MASRLLVAALLTLTTALTACGGGTATPTAAPTAPSKPTTAPAPAAAPSPAAAAAASPGASPVAKPATSPSVAASPAASPAPAAPSPAAAAAKPAATGPLTSVKYGQLTPPSVSDSGILIADAKGFFAEQGIKLDLVNFATAADMISPLGTNQVDAGGGSLGAGLYNAVARNIPLVIAADKATTSPGKGYLGLVIRKDLADSGAIKTPADLKGKKIALSAPAIAPEVALADLLKQGGLTIKDVEVVQLAFPDMVVALTNKSIDAAEPIEPFLTDQLTKGAGVLFQRADQYSPNLQNAVVLFSPNLAANTDLATRFMVAYLKGVRLYNDAFTKNDPTAREDVVNILSQTTSLKDRALYDKVAMPGLDPDGKVSVESLEHQQDHYVSAGEQPTRIDISKVVNATFAENAAKQLGPYR